MTFAPCDTQSSTASISSEEYAQMPSSPKTRTMCIGTLGKTPITPMVLSSAFTVPETCVP